MKALSPNSNSYQMLILEKNHNLPLLPSMASILFDLPPSRVMNSQKVHRSRFYALISDHPKITTNIFLFYNLRLEETATVLKSNPIKSIQNLNLLGFNKKSGSDALMLWVWHNGNSHVGVYKEYPGRIPQLP